MLNEAFNLFAKATPATVMIRGVLENILSEKRLNALFNDVATVQYTRDLTFASVVRLMSQVVMRIRPSVNAAYRQQANELLVTAKCVYNKLGGVEPRVSRELIRRTARELEVVLRTLGGELPSRLPGYRLRILDGNHLAGTDRRLKQLRGFAGAALPGQALAVLDPALKMVVDLFPWEDAHTQERAQRSRHRPHVPRRPELLHQAVSLRYFPQELRILGAAACQPALGGSGRTGVRRQDQDRTCVRAVRTGDA